MARDTKFVRIPVIQRLNVGGFVVLWDAGMGMPSISFGNAYHQNGSSEPSIALWWDDRENEADADVVLTSTTLIRYQLKAGEVFVEKFVFADGTPKVSITPEDRDYTADGWSLDDPTETD